MCFPSPGHNKSTMSNQAPDPTPSFSKMALCSSVRIQVGNLSAKCASLPWAIKNQQCPVKLSTLPPTFPKWFFAVLLGFRLGTYVQNVFPFPEPWKINNVHSGSWPYPQLFQNGPLEFCSGAGWEPECKMCFPPPGHRKSTMSSQAPDPAPNFSKIVLCSSVKVQVGNLSGKCASFPRAIKNQQCPFRLLTLAPTFPKLFFAVLFAFRLGTSVGNVLPFPGPWKINNVQSGSWPYPQLFQNCPLQFCSGFRLGTWVENVLPFPGP